MYQTKNKAVYNFLCNRDPIIVFMELNFFPFSLDAPKRNLPEDQVLCMDRLDMRGTILSDETIKRALQLLLACGHRRFASLREHVLPLPSEQTL